MRRTTRAHLCSKVPLMRHRRTQAQAQAQAAQRGLLPSSSEVELGGGTRKAPSQPGRSELPLVPHLTLNALKASLSRCVSARLVSAGLGSAGLYSLDLSPLTPPSSHSSSSNISDGDDERAQASRAPPPASSNGPSPHNGARALAGRRGHNNARGGSQGRGTQLDMIGEQRRLERLETNTNRHSHKDKKPKQNTHTRALYLKKKTGCDGGNEGGDGCGS